MVTLAFLIAACLDPVQAALVLAFVLVYRGPQPILIVGAAAAVVCETVMVVAADDYVWGELIAPRFVAALLQAAVLVAAVTVLRTAARVAGTALGVSWLAASDETEAFEASQAGLGAVSRSERESRPDSGPTSSGPASGHAFGPGSRRIALWHMRSHARRRVGWLRPRKIQP
jgi:hypothetical protein